MTILTGNVQDIGGNAVNGIMRIAATRTRPGNKQNAVIVDRWHAVNINQGRFTTPDLDPGSARIIFEGVGVSPVIEVDIPESGTHRLENIYQQSFEYSPAVIGRAQQAAQQAADYAQKAEKGAQRVGSAQAVLKAVEDAKGYKDASQQASSEALTARNQAQSSAQAAEQSKNQSQAFKNQAEAAAGQASSRAAAGAQQAIQQRLSQADQAIDAGKRQISEQVTDASGHAARAHEAAEQAGEHNTNAQQAKTKAQEQANAAQASATAADRSETQAGESLRSIRTLAEQARSNAGRANTAKTQAEQARTQAQSSASAASTSAEKAQQAANSAKTGAPDSGWPRSAFAREVQETLQRVDDVPTRQSLNTMLADRVTQSALNQALSGKMDQIPVSDAVTNSTVAKRTNAGRLQASDGHASQDLVTKRQLDQKANSSHTHSMSDISDLNPSQIVRAGSEPTLGRMLTIDGSSTTYLAFLRIQRSNRAIELYVNNDGDFAIYDTNARTERIVAKNNLFEHRTNVDMRENRIVNLPTPDGPQQPATKRYVDDAVSNVTVGASDLQGKQDRSQILTRLAEYSPTGGITSTLGIGRLSAVVTDEEGWVGSSRAPVKPQHLANKSYVDSQINEVRENSGGGSFWTGSRAEYDRIARKDPNRLYIVGA